MFPHFEQRSCPYIFVPEYRVESRSGWRSYVQGGDVGIFEFLRSGAAHRSGLETDALGTGEKSANRLFSTERVRLILS